MRLVGERQVHPDIAKQLGIAEIAVNRVEAARIFDRTDVRRSKI